jgi:hypothetical protein
MQILQIEHTRTYFDNWSSIYVIQKPQCTHPQQRVIVLHVLGYKEHASV